MKKNTGVLIACLVTMTLSACSSKAELEKYTMPDTLSPNEITTDVKEISELGALKKINPYQINPNFIENNLGNNSFSSLKDYVDQAVKAASDTGDLTKQEVELWNQIVGQESFSFNLVSNVADKVAEIDLATKMYAESVHRSVPEVLELYGMNMEQYQQFAEKQAEKFLLVS